ncbi:MAG: energy transducer TonB [Sphingomonadaceae bacterium]
MFTTTPFRNTATTIAASFLATTVCFAIATTPVQASDRAAFTTQVERSISQTMVLPMGSVRGVATVAIEIAADGSVLSAEIAKSSGNAAYDLEALRTANAVSYPKGAARTVAMVLGFGRDVKPSERVAAVQQIARLRSDSRRLQATVTTAQPIG